MRKKKTILIIAKTHQGRVRGQNEDRFVVIDTPRGSLPADGRRLSIAWSGDSRCYYYRRSIGLKQLSKDHSYVQMLVDEGLISAGETFLHPLGHIITQNLGDTERAPEPGTAMLDLTEGDICLFCSDGLNSMLTDTQIEKILQAQRNDLARCIDTLIEKANEYGGEDNITIILSKYQG
jgi:protein phosphatase